MKKILLALVVMGAMFTMQARELKVLAIGNSFSICVGRFLPAIVCQSETNKLTFASMYIGGCSLQQHWENFSKGEEDKNYKPYKIDIWKSSDPFNSKVFESNINEMLLMEKWDIVTIQQASHFSFRPETYEPFAGNLIAKIKELAPQAKVMVQQTWSYRKNDPRFSNNNGDWGVDQTSMYEKLTDAYGQLAERYGLEVIPTGRAVQVWRREAPECAVIYSQEELDAYKHPDVPSISGDVVGCYYWNKKDGKMVMGADDIHLNRQGEYLQACVWYLKLFGDTVDNQIKYVPNDIGDDFAALCHRCAAEAVK